MTVTPVEAALALARSGDVDGAAEVLSALMISELPSLGTARVTVSTDRYSLNSLNGTVTAADGTTSFFKLHVEEGEERTVEEYYRASLLHDAGWPVELPWFASTAPGRQFLLYTFQHHQRLADACLSLETGSPTVPMPQLVAAQEQLDNIIGAQMIASLHDAPAGSSEREPIHQLFHHRLVDPGRSDVLGGRAARFYVGASFDLADGLTLDWDAVRSLRWRVNGTLLARTFGELLEESRRVLEPPRLASHGAAVAHGDDHNANVWLTPEGLTLFDPAFAGSHLPALLAQVKATFHNIWAHPFWLYDPQVAETTWSVRAQKIGEELVIDTDWTPGALREAFLHSKTRHVWRPLLAALADRGALQDDWQRVLRCALFCCPTLVLDLRGRGPGVNALGLAVAVLMASEGVDEPTFVDRWIDSITP